MNRNLFLTAVAGVTAVVAGSVFVVAHYTGHSEGVAECKTPNRSEVRISGGTFMMGSEQFYEEEGPIHQATVASFSIDRFDVTNAQFAAFVDATGYVTDAEKVPDAADYPNVPPEKLVAGGAVFVPPGETGMRMMDAQDMEWWKFVKGADWRHPEGPNSTIVGRDNYPVVQVSYRDAMAYARWVGRTLPTEEQIEFAARGGLDGKTYAWGDEFTPNGKFQANTWQGRFPDTNTGDDSFIGVAPVGCFSANGYGLYDAVGNVWQWTTTLYQNTDQPETPTTPRVIKGGSFLCSENFCRRYRPAARQAHESSFSAAHIGFRTVSAQ